MCIIQLLNHIALCCQHLFCLALLSDLSIQQVIQSFIPFVETPLIHFLQTRCSHPFLFGCPLYCQQYQQCRFSQCISELHISTFKAFYILVVFDAFRGLLCSLFVLNKSFCNFITVFFLLIALNLTFIVTTIGA